MRLAIWLAITLAAVSPLAAQMAKPTVVDTSVAVLAKLTTQADRIPPRLIASAHGVAIIPGVVKGGLIVGIRRGYGVMLVRGAQGQWQPPTMVTLTGGSIGWQVGIQSTDLVLVFKNRRSVANLMQGKLTIGVDASAAAGPVGRKAQAATDGRLAAEIYSYSRSRGLFAGVSIDGATLKVDQVAQAAYYGNAPPNAIPASAQRLIQQLNAYQQQAGKGKPAPAAPLPQAGGAMAATDVQYRQVLAAQQKLQPLLNPAWRQFLQLPAANVMQREPWDAVVQRYAQVAADARYQALARRAEYQQMLQALQRYAAMLRPAAPRVLQLPPPPGSAIR